MRVLPLLGLTTAVVLAACSGAGDQTSGGAIPSRTAPPLPNDPEELLDAALDLTFSGNAYLSFGESDPAAVRKMGETGDQRFIAALIDILRFPWLLSSETELAAYTSLAILSGQTYVELEQEQFDWRWWVEWLSMNPEIEPLPGYAHWKGAFLAQLVGHSVGSFLSGEGVTFNIRAEEIVWGGVRRDGIPDLQHPPSILASEADYLSPSERVFGVSFNGESRAYPLRIMNSHEMANDVVGGVHFTLAYCTLCGSGIVYATEVNGEVISFGTSGLLYRSNKLMYDRETESLWVQFEGKPAVGPLADSGLELEILPVTLTTWRDWLALHPDTTVLDLATGVYPPGTYLPEDDPTSNYFDYRADLGPLFPIHGRSNLLPEKASVLGLSIDGQSKAYPLTLLEEREVANDRVGGVDVIAIATEHGQGARAYGREGLTFSDLEAVAGALTMTDDMGRRWQVTEDALVLLSDPSQELPRLESRVAYWFNWFQFHPTTAVFQ